MVRMQIKHLACLFGTWSFPMVKYMINAMPPPTHSLSQNNWDGSAISHHKSGEVERETDFDFFLSQFHVIFSHAVFDKWDVVRLPSSLQNFRQTITCRYIYVKDTWCNYDFMNVYVWFEFKVPKDRSLLVFHLPTTKIDDCTSSLSTQGVRPLCFCQPQM